MKGKIYTFSYMIILVDINQCEVPKCYMQHGCVSTYLLLPVKNPVVTFVGKDSPLGVGVGWGGVGGWIELIFGSSTIFNADHNGRAV
jgi:hypothetical protein